MEGDNLIALVSRLLVDLSGANENITSTSLPSDDLSNVGSSIKERPQQVEQLWLAGPDELSQIIRMKNVAFSMGFEKVVDKKTTKQYYKQPKPPSGPLSSTPSGTRKLGHRGRRQTLASGKAAGDSIQLTEKEKFEKLKDDYLKKFELFKENLMKCNGVDEKVNEIDDIIDDGGVATGQRYGEVASVAAENVGVIQTKLDLVISFPDGTAICQKNINEKLSMIEVELCRVFKDVESCDRRNSANSAKNYAFTRLSLVMGEKKKHDYHMYNGSTVCKLLCALHEASIKRLNPESILHSIFGPLCSQSQMQSDLSPSNVVDNYEKSIMDRSENMLPSLRGATKHYVSDQSGNKIDVVLTKFSEMLIGEMEKEKSKHFGDVIGNDDTDGASVQTAKQRAYSLDNYSHKTPGSSSPYLQSGSSGLSSRPSSRSSSVASSSRFSRRGRSHHSFASMNSNRSVVKVPREKFCIPTAPPNIPTFEKRRPMKSCWEEDVVEKALEMYRSVPFKKHLNEQLTCVEINDDKENVKNVDKANDGNKINNGDDDNISCRRSNGEIGTLQSSRSMMGNISVEEHCLIALGKIQIVNAFMRFERAHCSIKDQFGVTLSKESQKFLKNIWDELSSISSPELTVMQFSKHVCAVYGCEINELPIRCERCKSVFYCSKTHQLAHMAVHIPICPLVTQAKMMGGNPLNGEKDMTGANSRKANNTSANRKNRINSCGHNACRRYCIYFKKPEITEEQRVKRELRRMLAFK